MTELLAATKKGLFALHGEGSQAYDVKAREFPGEPVEFALKDERSGRYLASTTSPFYGPKIWYSDRLDGQWQQAEGLATPESESSPLARIWVIAYGQADGLVYAGADPAMLFESADNGASWKVNASLYAHPTRDQWQPGGGGLCLHSIATWPGEPDRLAVGISAAGVWLSEDRGRSWQQGNGGLLARYLPEDAQTDSSILCVHHLERAPLEPERLFMQFHGGVYRSDDSGRSWLDIGAGLPSDFSFPLAVDPADPDSAYVIPLSADTDRVTPGGCVRVYETRDAGASWIARSNGLPNRDAYLTVLRQAFCTCAEGDALELYFGTTTGEIFGSRDAGKSWFELARQLPPIYALSATP